MTLVEIFAAMGYIMVDICALCSALGSAILLLAALIGTKKKHIPNEVWTWSGTGLVLGVLLLSSLLWTKEYPPRTFLFGYSYTFVGFLLLISFIMIVISMRIRRRQKRILFTH